MQKAPERLPAAAPSPGAQERAVMDDDEAALAQVEATADRLRKSHGKTRWAPVGAELKRAVTIARRQMAGRKAAEADRDTYQAIAVMIVEERLPPKQVGMVRLEAARDFVEALKTKTQQHRREEE